MKQLELLKLLTMKSTIRNSFYSKCWSNILKMISNMQSLFCLKQIRVILILWLIKDVYFLKKGSSRKQDWNSKKLWQKDNILQSLLIILLCVTIKWNSLLLLWNILQILLRKELGSIHSWELDQILQGLKWSQLEIHRHWNNLHWLKHSI